MEDVLCQVDADSCNLFHWTLLAACCLMTAASSLGQPYASPLEKRAGVHTIIPNGVCGVRNLSDRRCETCAVVIVQARRIRRDAAKIRGHHINPYKAGSPSHARPPPGADLIP